jgi:hypothetical protein
VGSVRTGHKKVCTRGVRVVAITVIGTVCISYCQSEKVSKVHYVFKYNCATKLGPSSFVTDNGINLLFF